LGGLGFAPARLGQGAGGEIVGGWGGRLGTGWRHFLGTARHKKESCSDQNPNPDEIEVWRR
jgi:hypothetical protein